MSNIISLSGKRLSSKTRISPGQLMHHLRALWVSRNIDQDAYFLGNMVLSVMQQNDRNVIALDHHVACTTFVTAPGGQVLTGRVSENRLDFIIAIQQLHDTVGLHNAKNTDDFDLPDFEKRHFTRSPMTERNKLESNTSIYFRMPSDAPEQYANYATECFQKEFSKLTVQITLDPTH